jgi:large subunit ribosomal protein L21e
MAQRIGRFRRKTRHKLKKNVKDKGKIRISSYLQEFQTEDRVILKAEPAVQNGMYFPRFHGKSGIITGKQGKCYKVKIKDIKKEKTVLVHPIHLKKWQAQN